MGAVRSLIAPQGLAQSGRAGELSSQHFLEAIIVGHHNGGHGGQPVGGPVPLRTFDVDDLQRHPLDLADCLRLRLHGRAGGAGWAGVDDNVQRSSFGSGETPIVLSRSALAS